MPWQAANSRRIRNGLRKALSCLRCGEGARARRAAREIPPDESDGPS
jgi:hypothetical protein